MSDMTLFARESPVSSRPHWRWSLRRQKFRRLFVAAVKMSPSTFCRHQALATKKWRWHFQQEAQLPQRNSASAAHMEAAKPSSPLPLPLWLHLCVRSNPKPATNVHVRQACRPYSAL